MFNSSQNTLEHKQYKKYKCPDNVKETNVTMMNDFNTMNLLDGESKLYENSIFGEDEKNATLNLKSLITNKNKTQHSEPVNKV